MRTIWWEIKGRLSELSSWHGLWKPVLIYAFVLGSAYLVYAVLTVAIIVGHFARISVCE